MEWKSLLGWCLSNTYCLADMWWELRIQSKEPHFCPHDDLMGQKVSSELLYTVIVLEEKEEYIKRAPGKGLHLILRVLSRRSWRMEMREGKRSFSWVLKGWDGRRWGRPGVREGGSMWGLLLIDPDWARGEGKKKAGEIGRRRSWVLRFSAPKFTQVP